MENNEKLVPDGGTENVEQITTEESLPEKKYTEDEFNAKVNEIVGKRNARYRAKIDKEYARKYGDLEDVLRAGTGKEDVSEITDTFRDFYKGKGIEIRKKPEYSGKDLEVLARAEADEIIHAGYDEVVDEVDRLAALGADKMTEREKAVFKVLAEHRQSKERYKALSEIGVTDEEINSKEFKAFESKIRADVPITEVYEMYTKTKPQKEFKTAGSMKNTNSTDNGVKDYYSPEEARKFTKKELDENPALFNAIVKSMQSWKK